MHDLVLEKTEMKGHPISYWAKRYDLSERFLYNEVAAGRLRCMRFGRAIRVSPKQMQEYVEAAEG